LEEPSPITGIQDSQKVIAFLNIIIYFFKWQEYDDAQKDTLELNYQAEIQGQDNQGSGSSQPDRLEDLLKDADMALRRSQHLAARLGEDSSGQFKYQNQYVRFKRRICL